MIGEAVLAMEYGASCEDVARTCHAHPVRGTNNSDRKRRKKQREFYEINRLMVNRLTLKRFSFVCFLDSL